MTPAHIAEALHRAWPGLAADPAATEEYVRALSGLDTAAVAAVSAGIASQGNPPPKPGLLRGAILARTGPPPTGSTAPGPASPATAGLARGRGRSVQANRRMVLVRALLLTGGLAGLFTGTATQHPWAVVRSQERAAPIAHDLIPGGRVVEASARLTLVVLLLAVLFMFLRNRDRNVRQAFAAFAVLHGVSATFTVVALRDIHGAATSPPFADGPASVSTTGWVWQALLMSLLGAAVGVAGWRHVRRHPVPDRARHTVGVAPATAVAAPASPSPAPRSPAGR